MHAFRHAAAIAAASGVWGEKWSKDDVGKLLRDTSDAVEIYFGILADVMQDKMANVERVLTDSPQGVVGTGRIELPTPTVSR